MGRAMVLEKPGPIREAPLGRQDRDDAAPGAGEIAIEVSACAVCRTDLQLCEGDLAARKMPDRAGSSDRGTRGRGGRRA